VKRSPPVPELERIVTEMRIVTERAVHQAVGAPADAVPAIVAAAGAELDARVDRILEKRRWILARRGAK
jgi:multiple sugar transport system substrate-binding protein